MVDEVRLLRLLRSISDDLGVLRVEAVAGDARLMDPSDLERFTAAVAEWTETDRPGT